MIIQNDLSLTDKLEILSDAAKYDVACTSSGVNRKGRADSIGNTVSRGICHCFSADGRCISLLKILFTNECIFDCKYCVNRSSRDVVRTGFTPEEIAELTIEFYRRNYIEGLFLSSGIMKSPDYTMEQIIQAISLLRNQHHFNGYIHVKAIPGASAHLIEELGHLADRMSINLELPTADGLRALAPHKNRKNILTPMRQIQLGIHDNKYQYHDRKALSAKTDSLLLESSSLKEEKLYETGFSLMGTSKQNTLPSRKRSMKSKFVPAGQSTQMIIGATKETDYEILNVVDSLYKKFELKRVFYSAFVNTTYDSDLPVLQDGPPLLREHRLYQADWLLRFYGFQASELLTKEKPNFNMLLDPKCNWAMNHLEEFPLEVNRASYSQLLRVPGIGVKSAQRIVQARKHAALDFADLKKIGVVLKRALYFITCKGKMMYPVKIEEDYILSHMLNVSEKLPPGIGGSGLYQQISLFDSMDFRKANQNIG
ncbi:putative DNA modification/repair radical SAM protein [[Clostridium] polysaccharolyticum]|uniref:Putative DNA modification/repair radical SAM protein n=1 Tax=[Clostridium] polysaccharolyticum TaxID=29364 RepID=A0A1I0DXC7_9FIRM|nr:putative DNA modification/repair radical SAM protein [[Clostridium] polysaccharolyticum]SET37196.1 putative DNA modification/repair radical SAM protein [[Clostridium] polysaccharolyticum]